MKITAVTVTRDVLVRIKITTFYHYSLRALCARNSLSKIIAVRTETCCFVDRVLILFFSSGDCTYGWSMIVAAGGILCGYIVAICSCVLSAKTPLRSITQGNQLVEVKPASAAGGRRDFVTSRA